VQKQEKNRKTTELSLGTRIILVVSRREGKAKTENDGGKPVNKKPQPHKKTSLAGQGEPKK